MMSFLYLITAAVVGWQITGLLIPTGKTSGLNLIWVRAASSFGVGVLILTWPLYLIAYILHTVFANEQPLGIANAIVLGIAIFLITSLYAADRKKSAAGRNKSASERKKSVAEKSRSGSLFERMRKEGLISDVSLFKKEAVFYALVLAFVWFTFHYVLHMDGTNLRLGNTVFSDYAPNISLIRSFAWFPNYPTQYPFFAGEDIKYHFMFMFFTGNMEYLGLPLAFAYNLTGTLSLFGFFIILTQFALRITRRFSAAVLTAIFFTFRSGLALFMFIREHLADGSLIQAFRENTVFLGYTTSENWGLWNYNVYLNQRHLGFGLIIQAAVIWYFFGYIEEACAVSSNGITRSSSKAEQHEGASAYGITRSSSKAEQNERASAYGITRSSRLAGWFRDFVLSKEAWLPRDPDLALITGILLGLSSFWNGACVIGGLLILAGFAIFSQHKLDYVILAVCSVVLAELQTKAFIYGSAVSPTFYIGFISGTKDLPGMFWYLAEITGLTIVGSLAAAFVVKREEKILIAACWLPVIFTFTVSLTPDVTVNHKYIMMVMAYLSIIWANLVPELFSEKSGKAIGRRNIVGKITAVLLAVLMTATGLYDYVIIIRNNDNNHSASISMQHDLTAYVRDNLTYDDMVLSGPHSVSELTISGCRIYCGWPYYAWSAGYDTDTRYELAKEMYTEMPTEEIRELISEAGITYVLFERDMLYEDVPAREEPFAEFCDLVFESADGNYRLYKVR